MNSFLRVFNPRIAINTKRFLSVTPKLNNKVYTDSEEWISNNKMGITYNALEQLTEIIYIEYPCDSDEILKKGDDIVVIESVKAAETIEAPYDCMILENNTAHEDNLDNLNKDPECEEHSWLVKIKKL